MCICPLCNVTLNLDFFIFIFFLGSAWAHALLLELGGSSWIQLSW